MSFNRAIIFAGGKSSRMGKDKALLPFGEYSSLAEYQYRKLSKIFNKVYISAKYNKFDFDIDIIEDCYPISSPLVGIISIFERLDIDKIFILSVDMPFVDEHTIKILYNQALPSKDIIIAKSPNGLEPLCGIYKRDILIEAKRLLKADNHKLKTLLNRVNTQEVIFKNREIFTNLNYPFEYKRALSTLNSIELFKNNHSQKCSSKT
jgi:molybdopterin-guanine dinucleotide biosynthesis protein A